MPMGATKTHLRGVAMNELTKEQSVNRQMEIGNEWYVWRLSQIR